MTVESAGVRWRNMKCAAFAMVVVISIALARIAHCGQIRLMRLAVNMSCFVQNVMELASVHNFGRILFGLIGVRGAMAMLRDFAQHVEGRTKYHVRNAIGTCKCRKEGCAYARTKREQMRLLLGFYRKCETML